ncbi:hypothetical protein [endosymbiont GvMRE of Glomus versiforme]|uniref:hypothetical protein n=1 Tax=endosymbiont GvMRE of Glomus versiforme TaxID=2039283 RepID=UPI0011C3BC15|nr:hypothetical protein [endosymbiont GvMRE of Glomus versiforme]
MVKKSNKTIKNSVSRPSPKLTPKEIFWKEVAEHSKSLIANLIEKTLPISATPEVFDPEKDIDYCVLLREELPNSYADNEEYQKKITHQSWTETDMEYVSQDLVCAYFDLVVKALADWLSDYPNFENTSLQELKE